MGLKNDFNPNDYAEGGMPTFTGGLYDPRKGEPIQEKTQQKQQDAGLSQQQVGAVDKVFIKQELSPKPESLGGDFNENDWSPI